MTHRAPAYALAAALLLAGCTPQVSSDVTSQTLRAGDLQVQIDAPQWVTQREFYPLSVTYTNMGTQPITMPDPFYCTYIWNVVNETTGQVPQIERDTYYGCHTMGVYIILGPSESVSGTMLAIIGGFPKGQYRLEGGAGQILPTAGESLEPEPKEVRFEIR